MMRLDKLLCELGIGSRSQVKEYLKKNLILVDGRAGGNPEDKVDEKQVIISYKGKEYRYEAFVYYLLNKPQGYITATEDRIHKTVMELLPKNMEKDVVPVGRLDKDTEGVLLFTNDGELGHRLLAPKRHVDKVYEVTCEKEITLEMRKALETGIDLGEDGITKPAKTEEISEKVIRLTIHEGKYHQVKRMLEAVGNKVIFLKRLEFGPFNLEGIEEPGNYRRLSAKEIEMYMKGADLR